MNLLLAVFLVLLLVSLFVIKSIKTNKYLKRVKTPFDDRIRMYQPKKDGMYADWFGSLNRPIKDMCFEKDQILSFLEDNVDWFKQESINRIHFLFVQDVQIFVAYVYRDVSSSLHVYVSPFVLPLQWYVDHRYRLVVPRLADTL
jgi:hypothetical protein